MCVQLYYYILHVTFKCCFVYYQMICNGEHYVLLLVIFNKVS
jgi:hypothetical protein